MGRDAMDKVEDCRSRCAMALGADDPSQIIFTSGATESNNWIAHLFRDGLAISPFEHSSMREPALHYGAQVLINRGYQLEALPSALVQCVMLVNNETGAILSPPPGLPIHSDLTQAIGKVPLGLGDLAFASLSGHKFGGPKGVGLLYARDTFALRPFHYGGEHELGLRAGTLNVAGIVGLASALEQSTAHLENTSRHFEMLGATILDELKGIEFEINTPTSSSPAILNLSFPSVLGESLVVELDAEGFGISSGAACSSRSNDPSHVLTAMGYSNERIRGSIRISFGPSNTLESAQALAKALRVAVHRLRQGT